MPKRFNIIWFLLAAILIFLIISNVEAQHECQGGHNCNNSAPGVTTNVDTIIDGDRAFGIGVSGGDMDIDDCLATHSILFGLWQGTHINTMCEAARMDRDGNYLSAAEMRCSTYKYRKVYGKGQACIDAVIRVAPPRIEEIMVGSINNEDEDERYAEQQEEIEYLREETASLLGQIEYVTQQIERAPTVRPQIDSGAARRAKSREAYEKALTEGTEQ